MHSTIADPSLAAASDGGLISLLLAVVPAAIVTAGGLWLRHSLVGKAWGLRRPATPRPPRFTDTD